MMPYDITPTNDLIFKRIFGNEKGKVSLISLLNAILKDNLIVKDVKFLNTEIQNEDYESKGSRLDIEVETDKGTIVNVEMQCVDTGELDSRSVTYASQLVAQHTKKGYSYKEPKVISIWIIREKIKHGPMEKRGCPIEEASVCLEPNKWGGRYEQLTDKIKIIFVQLFMFENDEILKTLDISTQDWVKFLLNKQDEINSNDEGIKEAQHLWVKLSSNNDVRAMIRAREKYEMDKGSELATAREEGIRKGKEEGLKEGEKKGIEKGLIKGKKEGLIEGQKQIVLNMKNQGLDDNFIAKCLNISIDELNKLIK